MRMLFLSTEAERSTLRASMHSMMQQISPEAAAELCGDGWGLHACRARVQHQEDFSAGPFEDEEARAFYASLPDVRALVPALLLGDAAAAPAATDAAARDSPAAPAMQDAAPDAGGEVPGAAAEPANAMEVDGQEADAATAARGAHGCFPPA